MWVDLNAFFLYDTIEKPKSTFKTKPKPLPFKKKSGVGGIVWCMIQRFFISVPDFWCCINTLKPLQHKVKHQKMYQWNHH